MPSGLLSDDPFESPPRAAACADTQQKVDIWSDLALCFSGIALWRIVDKTTRFGFPRKPEPLPLNPREPIQRHDLTLLPLNR